MAFHLDVDDAECTYDEEDNPRGLRCTFEPAWQTLTQARDLWALVGSAQAGEIADLLAELGRRDSAAALAPTWIERLAGLLADLVPAAETVLVDDAWSVRSDVLGGGEEIERRHPGLGYWTTDGDGRRVYSLSLALSQVLALEAFLAAARRRGCGMFHR